MKKILLALLASMALSFSAFAAVNINTATQAELESLKNIGPVKAQAIIDYRKKNGGFKTTADLNNVPGIGDKTMEKLGSDISVSGTTTPVAATAKADKPAAKDMKKDAPVKEMAKKDSATPAATVKVDDKAAAKPADAAKEDKKAAADKAKADKAAAKADKKAVADKAKADKKAAADAKKAAKADKAPVEKK